MSSPKMSPVARGTLLFAEGNTAYEFLSEWGEGHHGETLWLARRRTPKGPGGEVILKCVHLPGLARRGLKARAKLEEELKLASHLRHEAIAHVHGMRKVHDREYLITECVDGNSLKTLVAVESERLVRFPDAFVLYVGAQVAGALAHAHSRTDEAGRPLGIVHRAVDLERIWVTWDGRVKLTDFGLALSRMAGRIASTVRRPRGDAYASSPEALLGLPVDARSDLFSLGHVLLELATGCNLLDPPLGVPAAVAAALSVQDRERVQRAVRRARRAGLDAGVDQLILRAATYTPEDVEEATAKLSEALRLPLRRLLQREPAARYETAEELEAELRARLDRLGAYGPPEAAREIDRVLVEAGGRLPGLGGGFARPHARGQSPDELTTR